jgi:hypothetical protein
VTGFATPEEAAGVGTPAALVRVVGVVVRGDQAIVAQVLNADGYPTAYETDTATCFREPDGWVCGGSGNGDSALIRTGASEAATVVHWLEAPPDAVAARFRLGEREEVVPVEDGFALVVFDLVRPDPDGFPAGWPTLESWLMSNDQTDQA